MTSSDELATEIAQRRKLRGLSKEKAAREAGISSITWKRAEDGEPIQDVKMFAIKKLLEIDVVAHRDVREPGDAALVASLDTGSEALSELRNALTLLQSLNQRGLANVPGEEAQSIINAAASLMRAAVDQINRVTHQRNKAVHGRVDAVGSTDLGERMPEQINTSGKPEQIRRAADRPRNGDVRRRGNPNE